MLFIATLLILALMQVRVISDCDGKYGTVCVKCKHYKRLVDFECEQGQQQRRHCTFCRHRQAHTLHMLRKGDDTVPYGNTLGLPVAFEGHALSHMTRMAREAPPDAMHAQGIGSVVVAEIKHVEKMNDANMCEVLGCTNKKYTPATAKKPRPFCQCCIGSWFWMVGGPYFDPLPKWFCYMCGGGHTVDMLQCDTQQKRRRGQVANGRPAELLLQRDAPPNEPWLCPRCDAWHAHAVDCPESLPAHVGGPSGVCSHEDTCPDLLSDDEQLMCSSDDGGVLVTDDAGIYGDVGDPDAPHTAFPDNDGTLCAKCRKHLADLPAIGLLCFTCELDNPGTNVVDLAKLMCMDGALPKAKGLCMHLPAGTTIDFF